MTEITRLECGAGWAEFDSARGALRRIGVGEEEMLHGIYAAARDASWGTPEPTITGLKTTRSEDGVTVAFDAHSRGDEVDISWQTVITLRRSGLLSYDFAAQARSASSVNRLGLCVLHPVSVAGRMGRAEHVDGSVTVTPFPDRVHPDVVFTDVRAIEHVDATGVRCRVAFTGDVFETEDQRNWTDLSFKTYCTPLRLPTPRLLRAGEWVRQRVDVELTRLPVESTTASRVTASVSTLPGLQDRATGTATTRPRIGCTLEPDTGPSDEPTAWAQQAMFDHVRVEVTAVIDNADGITNSGSLLTSASRVSDRVELALNLPAAPDTEHLARLLTRLIQDANRAGVLIERVVACGSSGRPPTPDATVALRKAAAPLPVWVGTDGNFTELNRQRPAIGSFDGLAFAANPQVHAFDDRSVAENAAGLAFCVRDACAMSDGMPVAVSPLTLLPSVNADAPDANPVAPPADPRQRVPFAAAWFVAAYAHAAASGAHAVTLGPLVGPAGLCNDAGRPYPIGLAVRAITRFGAVRARRDERSVPGWAEALVLERDGRERWLIALFEDGRWLSAPPGEGRWISGGGNATETESGWALAAEGPGVFQIDCEA